MGLPTGCGVCPVCVYNGRLVRLRLGSAIEAVRLRPLRLAAVHEKVRVAAERQGLPVLDLLDTYRSAQRAGESFVHDLAHPDAGGHAIAAAALLRFLQANGHLPAS